MYLYKALITRVVDGDTVRAHVDLGLDVWVNVTLRLSGINAPEMSTPAGSLARAAVCEWLGDRVQSEPWPVLIRTTKDRREKYGRYLAEVFHLDSFDGISPAITDSLNYWLLENDFAQPYDGGQR